MTIVNIGAGSINTEDMKPFIATVYPWYNKAIDYDKIKEARISGMAFFGGELYNPNHTELTYVSEHLDYRVKECNDAGMPYALYVNVRARNEIEADRECRALYYVISKYPPQLGIWLSILTNNSKSENDKIIEVYYKYFEKWGLKAKCGFYVTKAQLATFSWKSFEDRMYLWLIDDTVDITTVDDELLQPQLFEVSE